MSFEVNQRVGDYEVLQLLGAGGMGHVYRVRNIISNRTEAMKVLLPDLTAEPDLATRFIAEIRTQASFDHPNIAQLHTAFLANNQLIMMMEYVEGYTLEQIARQRTMPVAEIAGYISQTLSALSYAHGRGVIHRDIKPANLMVTSHGILKLMDFGIAKSKVENNNQTKPGTTIGSLYYMSPEQVRDSNVDARSDIYSVGVVLYELLAGRRPFEADTTFSILNQQLNVVPQPPIEVNPSMPPRLSDIIMMALAKDPDQRFQNADGFRNALKSFCTNPNGQEMVEPVPMPVADTAPPPPPSGYAPAPAYASVPAVAMPNPMQAAPPQRSSKPLWIATGAIAAVLALVAVGIAVPHWMKTRAATKADATVTTTPDTVATVPTPITATIAPEAATSPSAANSTPAAPAVAPIPMPSAASAGSKAASAMPPAISPYGRHIGGPVAANTAQAAGGAPQSAYPAAPVVQGPPAAAPGPSADVQEAEDRLIQINARAGAARRGVGQIRSQQEAMGLGLRSDVEAAESRLDSYLNAANTEIRRGNGQAAMRDIDKADAELATLDKFLGH
jgi:hypothetical protein